VRLDTFDVNRDADWRQDGLDPTETKRPRRRRRRKAKRR
jgi:hypothetical protein